MGKTLDLGRLANILTLDGNGNITIQGSGGTTFTDLPFVVNNGDATKGFYMTGTGDLMPVTLTQSLGKLGYYYWAYGHFDTGIIIGTNPQNNLKGVGITGGTDFNVYNMGESQNINFIVTSSLTQAARITSSGELWLANAAWSDKGDFKLQVDGNIYGSAASVADLTIRGDGTTDGNSVVYFDNGPSNHIANHEIHIRRAEGLEKIMFLTAGATAGGAVWTTPKSLFTLELWDITNRRLILSSDGIRWNFSDLITITDFGLNTAKITFGGGSGQANHLLTPDVHLKGTTQFAAASPGLEQGGSVYIYGGDPAPTGAVGNVIIGHNGTTTKGYTLVGTSTVTGTSALQVTGGIYSNGALVFAGVTADDTQEEVLVKDTVSNQVYTRTITSIIAEVPEQEVITYGTF